MNDSLIVQNDISSEIKMTSHKQTFFQNRERRIYSLNYHPNQDNDLDKVIIPFNFQDKKYYISDSEIAFFDKKNYLKEKLEMFNNTNSFKIEEKFKASNLQYFCLYFPAILIILISLYLEIFILALLSFSPGVFYTFLIFSIKGVKYLRMVEFIFLEKFRMKEINRILTEENTSKICIGNNLQWSVGPSGYWLELRKLTNED